MRPKQEEIFTSSKSRTQSRDPGISIFQSRNPGIGKDVRDCNLYTKYTRLVHKFRHRSTGYVLERKFTKFSEITPNAM